MNLQSFISLALSFPATVYGMGERLCGEVVPQPCDRTATTSSGEAFNPDDYIIAVPAPNRLRIRPMRLWLRAWDGMCVIARVVDRKNPRYVGVGGLDLSPGLIYRLTGKYPTRRWSGVLTPC